MMATLTTIAVTSSSIAIRLFCTHQPSLTPDLGEVERSPSAIHLSVAPPSPPPAMMATLTAIAVASSSVTICPFCAHQLSLAPNLGRGRGGLVMTAA
ncbi:hypothetical protein NL676_013402 [Syzygium grande]|nr:hypothetical protein NL676_013402 [Syzygium grande]